MKKLLVLFASLSLLTACNNTKEPTATPPQPDIEGESQNRCPSETVLLSVFSQNADSFEWRKDGAVIPGQTTGSLTVTESGDYSVAGVNKVGTGVFSEPRKVTINACGAVITGADANTCPEETVTLRVSSPGATVFEWRKDGQVIEGESGLSLLVSESGTYTAAPVHGGQPNEDATSKPKQVLISPCNFADALTGTWDVNEKLIWIGDAYSNNHELTIEKVDDTHILIHDFYEDATIAATVDPVERTITIDYQKVEVTGITYDGYLTAFYNQNICSHEGEGIGTIPVEGRGRGMSITFPSTDQIRDPQTEDIYDATWVLLAFDRQSGTCRGWDTVGCETIWTKK